MTAAGSGAPLEQMLSNPEVAPAVAAALQAAGAPVGPTAVRVLLGGVRAITVLLAGLRTARQRLFGTWVRTAITLLLVAMVLGLLLGY